MTKLQILNSKQSKKIYELLEHFAFTKRFGDSVLLQAGENIYLSSRELFAIGLEKLNINSLGVYIAEIKNGEVRLSIEGSQLIGPHSKKNVVELGDEEAALWMTGEDIGIPKAAGEAEGFVMLRHGKDFLGSGKIKNGAILNFVPKARRIKQAQIKK